MSNYSVLCKYRNVVRVAIEEALDRRRHSIMTVFMALGRAAGLHEKASPSYWTADFINENVDNDALRALLLEQLLAIHAVATERLALNPELNRLCAERKNLNEAD